MTFRGEGEGRKRGEESESEREKRGERENTQEIAFSRILFSGLKGTTRSKHESDCFPLSTKVANKRPHFLFLTYGDWMCKDT